MKHILLAMLAAATLTAGGCETQTRPWTTQDSWYHPAPPGTLTKAGTLNAPFEEVLPELRAEAESRLASTPVVELSRADATRYAGYPLTNDPTQKLFLVRAVLVNRASGHFSVLTDHGAIVVSNGSFARKPHPMERTALVIALPAAPRAVYATTWVAE